MKKRILIFLGAIAALILLLIIAAVIFIGSLVKTSVERVGPAVTKVNVKLDGCSNSHYRIVEPLIDVVEKLFEVGRE